MTTKSSKRERQKYQEIRRKKQQKMALFALIGVAAFALMVGAWRLSIGDGEVALSELGELSQIAYDGSPDAPIQIVEYGDFDCHACAGWHESGAKTWLKEQFGEQIAFQFRHFAWSAPTAAAASQCAADQDQFWEFHDYVYENAHGKLKAKDLKGYASTLGLDTETFEGCLDGGKYTDYVQSEIRSARASGARGTPFFLINGKPVNHQPETMAAAIRAILTP